MFFASAMGNQLAISGNPVLRTAQFSYNLIASVISGLIPLSIRLGKNPGDTQAGREMLAMLNNKMYQAREAYYASITLGMVQVCFLLHVCLMASRCWKHWWTSLMMITQLIMTPPHPAQNLCIWNGSVFLDLLNCSMCAMTEFIQCSTSGCSVL